MNKTIKTRTVVKDVKTLDRRTQAGKSIKTLGNEVKAAAETDNAPKTRDNRNPNNYAEAKVEGAMQDGVRTASQGAAKLPVKAANGARRARDLSKGFAQRSAKRASTKAAEASVNAAKGTIKQARKASVRTTSKSIKTATSTAKTAVKTSHTVVASVKGTAMGAKAAARSTVHTAQAATRTASAVIKAAAHAITAFIKLAVAAAKSLGAAIVALAGSGTAIVLVICLVGLIAVSAFGIFFTGGDMGDGNPTLREVVAEINEEHNQKIEEIKAANPHDEVALAGDRTAWKEVLAVFSVKTTTEETGAMDVVTLDEKRQQLLRDVFWEMNSIESHVAEREITEIVLEDDGNGNQIEANKTSTVKTLYITNVSKTADDAVSIYSFSSKQRDLLKQMLSSQYDSAWQSVLYGIRSGSGDLVEIAASQIGNVGGQPYWSWYGFSSRVEWCACFVSWCANEAGYIESGLVPKFSYCPTGVQWFKDAGRWRDRGYEPQPGDIIFFDWENDGVSDHVGIVESCDGSTVRTIEGNTSDSCARRSYGITDSSIFGYGTL